MKPIFLESRTVFAQPQTVTLVPSAGVSCTAMQVPFCQWIVHSSLYDEYSYCSRYFLEPRGLWQTFSCRLSFISSPHRLHQSFRCIPSRSQRFVQCVRVAAVFSIKRLPVSGSGYKTCTHTAPALSARDTHPPWPLPTRRQSAGSAASWAGRRCRRCRTRQ